MCEVTGEPSSIRTTRILSSFLDHFYKLARITYHESNHFIIYIFLLSLIPSAIIFGGPYVTPKLLHCCSTFDKPKIFKYLKFYNKVN